MTNNKELYYIDKNMFSIYKVELTTTPQTNNDLTVNVLVSDIKAIFDRYGSKYNIESIELIDEYEELYCENEIKRYEYNVDNSVYELYELSYDVDDSPIYPTIYIMVSSVEKLFELDYKIIRLNRIGTISYVNSNKEMDYIIESNRIG